MPRVIKLKDGTKYRMKTGLTQIARLRKFDKDTKSKRDTAKAIEYARWIAKRDGIAIIDNDGAKVEWGYVGEEGERAMRVAFRTVKITLPNWDYVPRVIDESELQSCLIDLSAHLSL